MIATQWFGTRMLEFNFLPSRTLHPSRFDSYALPGLAHVLQDKPSWQAAWHKHWSRSILRALGVGTVHSASEPQLMLALLCGGQLTALARRVGVALFSSRLRNSISGESVRLHQRLLGDELLSYARRDSARHTHGMHDLDATVVPQTLDEIEALGYGALLSSLRSSTPDVLRRFELKIPASIDGTESPLSSEQAWTLCVAVLNDMDPSWCSSFPKTL